MSIKEVINTKRTRNCVETTQIGGIIVPLVKMCNYKLYLYGGGRDIELYLSFFDRNDVKVEGIIDKNEAKKGQNINGVPYIMPNEFPDVVENPKNTFVVITTMYFTGFEQMKIMSVITKAGIDKFYSIDTNDKNEMHGLYPGWVDYFKKHISDFEEFYDRLYDDKSRGILEEYIRCVVACDQYGLNNIDGRLKYFWGETDSEGNKEELYSHLEDEVWLNCGANNGDSIFLYFYHGLNAHKIYAYEGHPWYYSFLTTNIDLLPEKYRQHVVPVQEYITAESDFSKIEEKITFINADIEGNELNLLKALEDRIKSDRPVVAICVYHKMADIVEIPKYLNTIMPNSTFVLRKYECLMQDIRRKDELVLYAIPNERKNINN